MAAQHRVPVLLTRPRAQAERFAKTLEGGFAPLIAPLLKIVFQPIDTPPCADETVLVTSENGVRALVAAGGIIRGQKALCVGDRTARSARQAGLLATSAQGTVEDLFALAQKEPGPFVHLRGAHARGDLQARLQALGKTCRTIVAYDQIACPLSAEAVALLSGGTPCLVPLFSPRTAALFVAACPEGAGARVLCLSPQVAEAAAQGRFAEITTVSAPDAAAMRVGLRVAADAIRLEASTPSR